MGTDTFITLGGTEYRVQIPSDFASRRELMIALRANVVRGLFAMVGLCVPDLHLAAHYERLSFDALRFGGLVWRDLDRRGIPEIEVIEAATGTIRPLVHAAAYPEEVAIGATVGFSSDPEEGPISSPSPSSEPGDASQGGSPA